MPTTFLGGQAPEAKNRSAAPGNTTRDAMPGLRVMRYEDVARGAPLVPLTPRRATAPPASQPVIAAPARGEAGSAGSAKPLLQRLPPADRTTPGPVLPPGTKLPQEPIKIEPEPSP